MKALRWTTLAVGILAGAAFASPDGGMPPTMTREQRNKMADAHEKFAACLRSEKPVGDCHEDLKKSCEGTMGAECPMMHGMHHGGGKPPHGQMK